MRARFLRPFLWREQAPTLALMALFALALALRAAVLGLGPSGSDGDWPAYARVAENILSGCGVSLSPPGSGVCVPHFGGNGLPGYSAFVALVWAIFGVAKAPVLWAQAIIGALAVPRLAYAMRRLAGPRVGVLCGLLAALSPLQAFMVRDGLAETLTLGAANWLIAELALSLVERRLRVVPVGLALAAALFLRLDSVVFALPILVVARSLYGVARAVRPGLLVVAIVCVPLGLWSVRNAAEGVGLLPPARSWVLPNGDIGPQGYLEWLKQWVCTQTERADTTYFASTDYRMIRLVPNRFLPARQLAAVGVLLADLRGHAGSAFPADIDGAFAALAIDARASRSWGESLALRGAQAAGLWARWAAPLPPEVRPASGAGWEWVRRSLTWGVGTLSNTMARCYRLVLGLLFLATLGGAAMGRGSAAARVLAVSTLCLVVAKTVLAVTGLFLDSRYTVTAVPFMEVVVVLVLVEGRPSSQSQRTQRASRAAALQVL